LAQQQRILANKQARARPNPKGSLKTSPAKQTPFNPVLASQLRFATQAASSRKKESP